MRRVGPVSERFQAGRRGGFVGVQPRPSGGDGRDATTAADKGKEMNAKLDNQAEGHQGTGDAGHRPTGVAHNLEDRRLVVVSEAGSVEREAGVAQRVVHVDGQHGLVSVCRPTLFLFRNAVRFDFRIAAGAKAKNQSNSGEGERREKYIGVNPPK